MRMKMLVKVAVIFLCCILFAHAEQKEDQAKLRAKEVEMKKAKETELKKLLVLTSSKVIGLQIVNQVIGASRAAHPKVPEEFWDKVQKDIKEEDFINLLVPVCDKYLSLEEVKEMVKFYESPAGKKFVSVLPLIILEGNIAGMQWGKDISARINKKLKEQKLE